MAEFYSTGNIIATCRRITDDLREPYFIPDEEYLDYLNRRGRELAERVLPLYDGRNYTLKLVAGEAWVYHDSEIIKIRNAYSTANPRDELKPVQANAVESAMGGSMDYGVPVSKAWRTATGTPYLLITDIDLESYRVVPIPVVNDTVQLEVFVYPETLTATSQSGSLPDTAASALHLGVLSDVMSKQDAEEIYSPADAAKYLGLWERELLRLSSQYERDRRASGRAVSYGGIA